jgi:hypothetical protein
MSPFLLAVILTGCDDTTLCLYPFPAANTEGLDIPCTPQSFVRRGPYKDQGLMCS